MTVSAGSNKLKVLFFSQRFPYPMDTGGKIRTGKILEQLRESFELTLVSNMERPRDDPYLDPVKRLCARFYPVFWTEVKRYTLPFYLKLLWSVFSRYPFTVINDYSKDLESTILNLTRSQRFDLLICDFLQPSLNVNRVKGVPMLLFQHNIESIIPRRHFETSGNMFAKLFWWVQWRKMERYEQETCRRFGATITVSETDKKVLENSFGIENVFSIPTGVDTSYFAPSSEPVKDNSLVFTGSMDWLPNEDAMIFFASEILGRIKQEIPDITLTVVGRNPSACLLKELSNHPEIEVVGWVEDVRPYVSRHALFIIPLRIGGGTRIKAYEAMAMGKAMVSTRIGVEGLPVQDQEHLLLADEPEEFAAAVTTLLRDIKRRKQIEANARTFVETHCSWRSVAEVFVRICARVAASPGDSNGATEAVEVWENGNVRDSNGDVNRKAVGS